MPHPFPEIGECAARMFGPFQDRKLFLFRGKFRLTHIHLGHIMTLLSPQATVCPASLVLLSPYAILYGAGI